MADARPLTFIWRRATLDSVLEGYFIKDVLLAGLRRPVRILSVEDDQPIPLGPGTLLGSLGPEMAPVLQQARAHGIPNVGLFHMGDEEGKEDLGFYADAAYVIRNYWFPAAVASPGPQSLGVIWAPNGYRTGLGPIDPARQLPISLRDMGGFFSGVLTGRHLADEREAMVQAVGTSPVPCMIMTTPGFGQGLGPTAYGAWLCNSRFALVPAGNSHETIRLYDALEAGAIPVMVRSAFVSAPEALGALGEPPFILLNAWSDLAQALAPYANGADPGTVLALEERRAQVARWWTAFKQHQQTKVAALIDTAFARDATQ